MSKSPLDINTRANVYFTGDRASFAHQLVMSPVPSGEWKQSYIYVQAIAGNTIINDTMWLWISDCKWKRLHSILWGDLSPTLSSLMSVVYMHIINSWSCDYSLKLDQPAPLLVYKHINSSNIIYLVSLEFSYAVTWIDIVSIADDDIPPECILVAVTDRMMGSRPLETAGRWDRDRWQLVHWSTQHNSPQYDIHTFIIQLLL